MRTEVKIVLLSACVLILAVIGIRVFNHANLQRESTAIQPADESSVERFSSSRPPTPQREAAAILGAPLNLPEDPDELREWARQDAGQALIWLRKAPANETRDIVVEMVCARVAESDPAEAVSLAEAYSGGSANLLENMVHQWADQNEPAAAAYAMSKSPGEERDRLLSRVAFVLSKENPAEAAKLVAEWISPGEIQNEAAISVLHQWTLRDPDAASAWAELFPASPLRERALNEVALLVAK